jgi:hypothetical protein
MAVVSLKYKSKQGTLTAPGDVDPGAMIPIATTTVGSTSVSTITFSDIPQVYEHLQIRGTFLSSSNGSQIGLRLNSDSGNNYTRHNLYGDGGAAAAFAGTAQPNAVIFGLSVGTNTSNPAVAIIDILDYANTNKNTTIRTLSGSDWNGSGEVELNSALWINTNAVTSLTFIIGGGNTYSQHSRVALYGIKRAGA